MTFDEILAQVLDLLQRQGRVSYRALKRRFDLDDAYLEDLKAEIIKAQRLAIDEAGEVLVWAGAPPPQTQGAQPPDMPAARAMPMSPAAAGREAPEAERRQLTVLFCDLVDSTALAARLDPEELREVVRAYQAVCAEVIGRFEGHIAQYLGDGLLVYFGYPLAHEDDAQRAVRAGLGILEALEQLNTRLTRERGIRLAVRLGIHTGLVVVGEMGAGAQIRTAGARRDTEPGGAAAGLAAPDTVVISATTYRLVQGFFACHDLGSQTLKGSPTPVLVYRVLGESDVQSRLETAGPSGLTPLVGREPEVTLLQERWAQSTDGLGQVVLLSGEAGIGKSRLVQVLKAHVESEPHTRLECRCSPYYQNSALYPVIDLFQRALQLHRDDTPQQKLSKLEGALEQYGFPLPDIVPLFASLLSLPLADRYPALTLTPQQQRQKTLEAVLAEALVHMDTTGEVYFAAEVCWLKGELLLRQAIPDETQAEACLHQALDIARHQQTRAWELRAAVSLARLWQRQGKRAEAQQMLAEIYGWFTEGFDTVDLQEAKALLEELKASTQGQSAPESR